jgi:hypothetical protein
MKALVIALVCALAVAGCGNDDVTVEPSSILNDPVCDSGSGQFQLLAPGGAILLVFINPGTQIILMDGSAGTCTDLTKGAAVQVEGTLNGQTLNADTVRLT